MKKTSNQLFLRYQPKRGTEGGSNATNNLGRPGYRRDCIRYWGTHPILETDNSWAQSQGTTVFSGVFVGTDRFGKAGRRKQTKRNL
jgi:hypothetical protein